MAEKNVTIAALKAETEELRRQLFEATETLEAIRTGEVDTLVVQKGDSHELYTLQTADHAYRIFIEKMMEGALTLNKEGVVLYSNSGFANMLGLPLSQILGLQFQQMIAEDHVSLYDALCVKCTDGDCRGEMLLKGQQGAVPVQLSFAAKAQGEADIYNILVTDLRAQKAVQEKMKDNNRRLEESNGALELSNRDLLQFASVASHDLQEPVRKISIFANLIAEEDMENLSENSKDYLRKIMRSTARMKLLITDLLGYSRLADDATNNIERTDLNKVLREVLEDIELAVKDKGAEIVAAKLPVIQADAGRLRQVFQNIISNSLKFARAGMAPVITISATRIADRSFDAKEDAAGAYHLIRIRDNGIGFDAKFADVIFNLFERLNSKDKYEGTGIGLSTAKKIVEKHGGLVMARSKEQEGARIFNYLAERLP